MSHGFLNCLAPLRRARLHTLGCPRAPQREAVQLLDVCDPAGLRNDAVPLLQKRLYVLVACHDGLPWVVFLRFVNADLIVERCAARRPPRLCERVRNCSLNIALDRHRIHVREQLTTVARYRNFDLHIGLPRFPIALCRFCSDRTTSPCSRCTTLLDHYT